MSAVTPIRQQSTELPEAFEAYLAEQQSRARELQALLEMASEHFREDEGVLAIAARVAHGLNEALDGANVRKALSSQSEETAS